MWHGWSRFGKKKKSASFWALCIDCTPKMKCKDKIILSDNVAIWKNYCLHATIVQTLYALLFVFCIFFFFFFTCLSYVTRQVIVRAEFQNVMALTVASVCAWPATVGAKNLKQRIFHPSFICAMKNASKYSQNCWTSLGSI